jgi:tRNA modification GTPase
VRTTTAALERGDVASARTLVDGLARWTALGRRLTEPWRVVVAGAPNAGKSSLINALAGYQRSVVAPTPGTTRDVVTTRIAVDGCPVELADTAGIRDDAGTLEQQGIERARRASAEADLVLWVLDASAEPVWPEAETKTHRLVINKIDLQAAWDLTQASDAARVSALTGEGISALCACVARWLVPDAPPPGTAVPFTKVLCDAVEAAGRWLRAGEVAKAEGVLNAIA